MQSFKNNTSLALNCKISKLNKVTMIFVLLMILACFSSCAPKQDSNTNITPPTLPAVESNTPNLQTTPVPTSTPEPTLEPGIPNILGLYVNDGGTRKLVANAYTSEWTAGTDIKCFEAVTSNEETLSGSGFADIWNTHWNNFANTANTKIAYTVTITLKSGEILTYDIKTPADTKQHRDYVETYLYDDVHQAPGQWYSHLEDGDINDKTIATSLKLTAGSKINEVKKISLTGYLYTTDKPERIIASYKIDVLNGKETL